MSHLKRISLFSLLLVLLAFLLSCSSDPAPYVDDAEQAGQMLEEERAQLVEELEQQIDAGSLDELVELGHWEEARNFLDEAGELSPDLKTVEAKLLFKKHRYDQAEELVADILEEEPGHLGARLLQADLHIQAWRLDEADRLASEILDEESANTDAGVIRGRVALLNREYDEAMEWAEEVKSWDSNSAGAYLLEAETLFWDQDPSAAEPALQKVLDLNPFNADARFSYGYAIWRRVDATQLDNMAAQWNLAFEINPLHYLTHWHFGNGHTNLTYADYAHPTDEDVREELDEADELVPQNWLDEAIEITHEVEGDYPESVLPAMMRGSIFYMYYDMDRSARLDSAQAAFEGILDRKQNYGPAHNGLAAVIKQRQFEYLDGFEGLEEDIQKTSVPDEGHVFYDIFKDAEYYPGDRVTKMIAQQVGPSEAYLPLIDKFGDDFAIPPLHIDLAEAMDRSYFRYGTTFDNRQWMDIRGVGSGATGIEYLERGAHWERNVLAHEYAHLYHGRILTDRESRRIRALYHEAMENDRTLDYYASNNESEFFAQGYAGFLSEKKVHALNHKSMNTREYIREKDPEYYEFLDSLLQKQQEYLDGNEEVFDNNWAQTYLSLAEREPDDPEAAIAYLDTALTYSSDYVPVHLEYAEVQAGQGAFEEAEERLDKAKDLDETYAPLFVTEADIAHQKALQEELSFEEALDIQLPLFEQAYEQENDLSERASVNRLHRERLQDYGKTAESIEIAEQYVEEGPEISTYLRDRKEEAEAHAHFLRGMIGYSDEVADFFRELTGQNPQNFDLRRMYADVLIQAQRADRALEVLEEGQRILESAGDERSDYALRMAQAHLQNENESSAEEQLESVEAEDLNLEDRLLLARIYAGLDRNEEAEELAEEEDRRLVPAQQAELEYTKGVLTEIGGNIESAEEAYREAVSLHPYHLRARAALINLLEDNDSEMAEKLRKEAEDLPIPVGPDFAEIIG